MSLEATEARYDKLTQIKTKSVVDPIEKSDGVRILITRYHPRIKGFKKGIAYQHWLRSLAPDGYTLAAWQARKVSGFTAADFKARYWDAVYDAMWYNNDDWQVIEGYLKSGATITLLCYEKAGEFCHRHILKEFLERRILVIGK
jgi:uncharacterized protein YeaO (DUF488 family)